MSYRSVKVNGLSISLGNSKLGDVPNVSLLPGAGCPNGKACYKDCYARKFALMYKGCREAWSGNLKLWKKSPVKYMNAVSEFLKERQPKFFRWHVAGDIQNQEYLNSMVDIAMEFGDTRFLAFTKMWGLRYVVGSLFAPNLRIVGSRWPGSLVDGRGQTGSISTAWVDYGRVTDDPGYDVDLVRVKTDSSTWVCPGSCISCHACWNLYPGQAVVFGKH